MPSDAGKHAHEDVTCPNDVKYYRTISIVIKNRKIHSTEKMEMGDMRAELEKSPLHIVAFPCQKILVPFNFTQLSTCFGQPACVKIFTGYIFSNIFILAHIKWIFCVFSIL